MSQQTWEQAQMAARLLDCRHVTVARPASELLTGSPEVGVETQESAERAGDAANADRNVQERRRLDDRRIDRAS